MQPTALRAAADPERWADRTDHEVADAAPADEMVVALKALRDIGACPARSRTLGRGRMYGRLAHELRGGV